jgi:TonB-linked SusC/RagA family outer membrane protein
MAKLQKIFINNKPVFLYRINIFIFSGILIPLFAFAQQIDIEGRILDENTNTPIIGANIFLLDKATGAVSDINGSFTIAASFPAKLLITYIGYKTQEAEIYEYSEPVTIFLREDLSALNEVVVTGYGKQKRQELTGAIVSVPKSVLTQRAVSFDNLLGGVVAGLNVTQSSGQPGATSKVRIRGGNSITGGNEPLYVIDGVIVYNDYNSTKTGGGAFEGGLNPLTAINTADIESVEVLKDVSATAIYGSRGANGVIIITTQKGKKGSNTVDYTNSFGWSAAAKKLDLLGADEWVKLQKEIGNNKVDGYNAIPTDWQDAALRTGFSQTHQLSISGGDEATRYLVSGNFTGQDGIVRSTGLERYVGRINLDRDVFKFLNIGANVNLSQTKQNGFANYSRKSNGGRVAGSFDYALRQPPIVPVYNADGSYNYTNPFSDGDFHFTQDVNPISDLDNISAETRNLAVFANFYANWTIIPSLLARINSGFSLNNTTQNFYAPSTSALGLTQNGYGSIGNRHYNTWQNEFTLNYTKLFAGIHSLDVLAGFTNQKTFSEYSVANVTNFPNESLRFHGLSGGSTFAGPNSGGVEAILYSWLGRVNYSLHERYNLTATLRADGSSRFAAGHHWGYFPSIGLAWNINNEPFFNKNGAIGSLKLRLSAGTVGNQEIGDYQYEDAYVTQYYSFDGTPAVAFTRSARANPNLKWETTTQYNAGLDFGLRKDRLTASIDLYSKETTDLLVDIPLEQTTGFVSTLANIGTVTNKGVELEVNGIIVDRKNFRWTVSGNIARNVNEVTSLGGQTQFFPYVNSAELQHLARISSGQITIVKVGEPLGSFFGYEFDGVDPATGAVRYVDQGTKDGVISEDDRVVLGNAQPDFTYGLQNNLLYKGLDFSFAFAGSQGNQLYNGLRQNLETVTPNYNVSADLANRWTPENPSTTIPKAETTSVIKLDSRYIEDASWLKLKNITVGYTIPFKWSRLPKAKLRIYASAQNLWTITKYKGYDPESSRYGGNETSNLFQGVDFGAYPSARTFLFGINITL